jgi:RNA 3'-terminal phosphate cyclase (ATP)
MRFLEIDGSFGEGGGQIVRTSISLSSILGKPIVIENIRKGRKKSGLKPQHVTALKILRKICDANIDHLKIGSTSLRFDPMSVKSLELKEDVGTAGSISLILQVLIPVIAISKKKLKLRIVGGTNVLWSPTIDYTKFVLSEIYSRMGIKFSINLIKRGYYPKGGGIVEIVVEPSEKVIPVVLGRRKTRNVKLLCSYSKLSKEVINDQIKEIEDKLFRNNYLVTKEIYEQDANDSGATLLIWSIDNYSIIGKDSLFDIKQKKFDLILDDFVKNNYSVDENLADMLVLPASLANGMSIFQIDRISTHLETNLFVASKITGCKYGIGQLKEGFEVRIQGISYSGI